MLDVIQGIVSGVSKTQEIPALRKANNKTRDANTRIAMAQLAQEKELTLEQLWQQAQDALGLRKVVAEGQSQQAKTQEQLAGWLLIGGAIVLVWLLFFRK
jgi:hypothetical protein